MLILPVVNNHYVMNVQIKLKNMRKVRQGVCFEDAIESDIIVNSEKFSNSTVFDSKDRNSSVDFIRSKSILYPRNFLVTTKSESDSKYYDVYEVGQPPKKVNDSLDDLYDKAVTDLRQEIPNADDRGRYISFEDLGIGDNITNEKLSKLQRIVSENRDNNLWPKLFKEAGIEDLEETVNFMKNFDCTVISDSKISEDSLKETINCLSIIRTRDYKNLNKYYNMAKSNSDIYTKLSYINRVLYNKPLALIKAPKGKQLVKKKEEVEYKNVA